VRVDKLFRSYFAIMRANMLDLKVLCCNANEWAVPKNTTGGYKESHTMNREAMCLNEEFPAAAGVSLGSSLAETKRAVPEGWTDLRKDPLLGPRIAEYMARLQQNCSEHAYNPFLNNEFAGGDHERTEFWKEAKENDPTLDRAKLTHIEFATKMLCVDYAGAGGSNSSQLAFAPTMGSRFLPPTIKKGNDEGDTLTLSCGKDTKKTYLYPLVKTVGAGGGQGQFKFDENVGIDGKCNEDSGCYKDQQPTVQKGDPIPCFTASTLAPVTYDIMKQDGGEATVTGGGQGGFPWDNGQAGNKDTKCLKATIGGPSSSCCPPASLTVSRYDNVDAEMGRWEDGNTPQPSYEGHNHDVSFTQNMCYHQFYGDTDSCESSATISVFGCDDGCGCKPDPREECFCTHKDDKTKVDVVEVHLDHQLKPGYNGACRNWFTLVDAGFRAFASELRSRVIADKLAMCGGGTAEEALPPMPDPYRSGERPAGPVCPYLTDGACEPPACLHVMGIVSGPDGPGMCRAIDGCCEQCPDFGICG